jgi:hypothetical protein
MFGKKNQATGLTGLNEKMDQLIEKMSQLADRENIRHQMAVDNYLQEFLFTNPKYLDNKRLNQFEYQVFSQFGEDGIINEIFQRIGTTNRYFIEFGVENGTECNTTNLLHDGWQGLWIEANANHYSTIVASFSKAIQQQQLVVKNSFITSENIEELFKAGGALREPDLLSIDIDRNDYHVWRAIDNFRPRVIVIEYNAIFRPGQHFVVEYDANATWDGSSYFGASLDAYYQLGLTKGYRLVGCSFSGVNAFFVREDLVADHFESPFTPEVHYEPARYFLYKKDGHYRKIRL